MGLPALYDRWRGRIAWAALIAWSGVIWFANTRPELPTVQNDTLNNVISQGGHLLGHTVLAILAWRAATTAWGHRTGYWVTLVGTSLHSVLDEAVQRLVPTRNANLEDVVYNVAGCMLGIAVMEVLRLGARERSRRQNGARAPGGRPSVPPSGSWPDPDHV